MVSMDALWLDAFDASRLAELKAPESRNAKAGLHQFPVRPTRGTQPCPSRPRSYGVVRSRTKMFQAKHHIRNCGAGFSLALACSGLQPAACDHVYSAAD